MIRITAALTALMSGASMGYGEGTLYGVASFSNFEVQSLYAIDAATGSATRIGSTGLRQIAGLEYDRTRDLLVALTVGGDMFAIDRSTGASSRLNDGNVGVPEGGLAFGETGMGYTTLFDDLYTWDGGAWSRVGSSGLSAGADISGLAMGRGVVLGLALNGTGADELVSFDLSSGAAMVIGRTGTNAETVGGLTFDFLAGSWYMSDGGSLYEVDGRTGAASLRGVHGVGGLSGLAFVPTPGAGLLLGGLFAASCRRRR